MCTSKTAGGRRCAAHTRPAYQHGIDRLLAAENDTSRTEAYFEYAEKIRDYARTPTGQREHTELVNRLTGSSSTKEQRVGELLRTDTQHGSADETFLASADKQGRVKVENYKMKTHPKSEYPVSYASYGGAFEAMLAPETFVHTTQTHVYADHVIDKSDGSEGEVLVARQRVCDKDGNLIEHRIWIIDGHHTLVAARRNNLPVKVTVCTGRSGDPIMPPKLCQRHSISPKK